MKTIIMALAASISFAACNNDNKTTSKENNSTRGDSTVSQPQASAINLQPNGNESINELLSGYLQLKNALANDEANEAATAGNSIVEALKKIDKSSLTPEQQKVYEDVSDDVKENAEHIAANADKIAHQREHFEMLSSDMYDLVKSEKTSQKLYKDFCPMYNDGKGAAWISETKEIKNPYLGKKMTGCGEVKEEINK